MTLRLSGYERQCLTDWLDCCFPEQQSFVPPEYVLHQPDDSSIAAPLREGGFNPNTAPLYRTHRVTRERLAYGRGQWWQWVAVAEDGEPVAFGKIQRGPSLPPIHIQPVAEDVARRLNGHVLDYNSAEFLRQQIRLREVTK